MLVFVSNEIRTSGASAVERTAAAAMINKWLEVIGKGQNDLKHVLSKERCHMDCSPVVFPVI